MNERGKMEIYLPLGIIVVACLLAIGFHLFAQQPESSTPPMKASLSGAFTDANVTELILKLDEFRKSLASVEAEMSSATMNIAKLRLEVESVKSQRDFPQKVLLSQEKTWEVHLVPNRPVGRPKKGLGVDSLIPPKGKSK